MSSSSSSCSPLLQSSDTELRTEGQCANPTTLGSMSATKMEARTPTTEAEQCNHGFIPILPASTLPQYLPLSSISH